MCPPASAATSKSTAPVGIRSHPQRAAARRSSRVAPRTSQAMTMPTRSTGTNPATAPAALKVNSSPGAPSHPRSHTQESVAHTTKSSSRTDQTTAMMTSILRASRRHWSSVTRHAHPPAHMASAAQGIHPPGIPLRTTPGNTPHRPITCTSRTESRITNAAVPSATHLRTHGVPRTNRMSSTTPRAAKKIPTAACSSTRPGSTPSARWSPARTAALTARYPHTANPASPNARRQSVRTGRFCASRKPRTHRPTAKSKPGTPCEMASRQRILHSNVAAAPAASRKARHPASVHQNARSRPPAFPSP